MKQEFEIFPITVFMSVSKPVIFKLEHASELAADTLIAGL